MDRHELAREIYDFHDYHRAFPGEAYKFDIKIHGIDLPKKLRDFVSEEAIDRVVQSAMHQALEDHVEELKQKFPWIRNWTQTGRMGGWLVLAPHYPVLTIGHRPDGVAVPEVEPEDVKAAQKRLRDLKAIDSLTKKDIRALVAELESPRFWREAVPAYPGEGPKAWDPRE